MVDRGSQEKKRKMVRKEGFEPPRPFGHKILSLARLPVPPLPHRNSILSVGVARFHRDFAQASFGSEGIRSAGKQRFLPSCNRREINAGSLCRVFVGWRQQRAGSHVR